MAEVIKYGAIADRALFDRVAQGVKPDDDDLAEIVEKCVAIKARVVEREAAGGGDPRQGPQRPGDPGTGISGGHAHSY